MAERPSVAASEPAAQPERDTPERQLLVATYVCDIYGIKTALKHGADINTVHPETGLSALHIAVGVNDLRLCRFLIDNCGARFFPDRLGRWPSLIAAECRVDDELSDYIVEQEARFLEQNRPS